MERLKSGRFDVLCMAFCVLMLVGCEAVEDKLPAESLFTPEFRMEAAKAEAERLLSQVHVQEVHEPIVSEPKQEKHSYPQQQKLKQTAPSDSSRTSQSAQSNNSISIGDPVFRAKPKPTKDPNSASSSSSSSAPTTERAENSAQKSTNQQRPLADGKLGGAVPQASNPQSLQLLLEESTTNGSSVSTLDAVVDSSLNVSSNTEAKAETIQHENVRSLSNSSTDHMDATHKTGAKTADPLRNNRSQQAPQEAPVEAIEPQASTPTAEEMETSKYASVANAEHANSAIPEPAPQAGTLALSEYPPELEPKTKENGEGVVEEVPSSLSDGPDSNVVSASDTKPETESEELKDTQVQQAEETNSVGGSQTTINGDRVHNAQSESALKIAQVADMTGPADDQTEATEAIVESVPVEKQDVFQTHSAVASVSDAHSLSSMHEPAVDEGHREILDCMRAESTEEITDQESSALANGTTLVMVHEDGSALSRRDADQTRRPAESSAAQQADQVARMDVFQSTLAASASALKSSVELVNMAEENVIPAETVDEAESTGIVDGPLADTDRTCLVVVDHQTVNSSSCVNPGRFLPAFTRNSQDVCSTDECGSSFTVAETAEHLNELASEQVEEETRCSADTGLGMGRFFSASQCTKSKGNQSAASVSSATIQEHQVTTVEQLSHVWWRSFTAFELACANFYRQFYKPRARQWEQFYDSHQPEFQLLHRNAIGAFTLLSMAWFFFGLYQVAASSPRLFSALFGSLHPHTQVRLKLVAVVAGILLLIGLQTHWLFWCSLPVAVLFYRWSGHHL